MVDFGMPNSDIVPVVERSGVNSRKMKALAELKRPFDTFFGDTKMTRKMKALPS